MIVGLIDFEYVNEIEHSLEQGRRACRFSRRVFLCDVKYYWPATSPLNDDVNVFGSPAGQACRWNRFGKTPLLH